MEECQSAGKGLVGVIEADRGEAETVGLLVEENGACRGRLQLAKVPAIREEGEMLGTCFAERPNAHQLEVAVAIHAAVERQRDLRGGEGARSGKRRCC